MKGAHSPRPSTLPRLCGTVSPELPGPPGCVKGGHAAAAEQGAQGGEHTPTAGDALDAGVAAMKGGQLDAVGDHIGRAGHQHGTPHRLCQLGGQSASRLL